jgi:hypothetical protein
MDEQTGRTFIYFISFFATREGEQGWGNAVVDLPRLLHSLADINAIADNISFERHYDMVVVMNVVLLNPGDA